MDNSARRFTTKFMILYMYVHMHFLKVKPRITRHVKHFVPGISTRNNLFKEAESVSRNASVRSTSFEQMLAGVR